MIIVNYKGKDLPKIVLELDEFYDNIKDSVDTFVSETELVHIIDYDDNTEKYYVADNEGEPIKDEFWMIHEDKECILEIEEDIDDLMEALKSIQLDIYSAFNSDDEFPQSIFIRSIKLTES